MRVELIAESYKESVLVKVIVYNFFSKIDKYLVDQSKEWRFCLKLFSFEWDKKG